MAKVKAPLLSLDARGKIGDALVYMGWKGIKDVRQHVVPANPQTAGQTTQRGYMTAAVAAWHDANLTGADQTAWNLFATVAAKIQSGFNRFTKNYLDGQVAGKTFVNMLAGTVAPDAAAGFDADIDCGAVGKTVKLRYGLSKTAMINEATMDDDADNTYSDNIAALTIGAKYYVQMFISLPAGEDTNTTGIFSVIIT